MEALCGGVPEAAPVAPTQAMILRAFRELPLYRGAIRTDPVGWTLVNLDTYFWCGDSAERSCAEIGQPERRVTLLGQQVRIRPRIVAYTWSFGDGSADRGGDRVRHAFRRSGTTAVRLTLTWTAEYAVGGAAFQPISGTTTTTGPPLTLPVREARSVLVGGR